jgi:hypothetical protein
MEANSNQEIEKGSPAPYTWNTPETKMKHLEMIQAVITRMANNQFMVKGWCITLVSALVALSVGKDGNPYVIVTTLLPVVMFWYLDGFFLQQERLFRKIYDRHAGKEKTDFQITPNKDLGEIPERIGAVMWRPTIRVLYIWLLAIVLLVSVILIAWRRTTDNVKGADKSSSTPTAATGGNTVIISTADPSPTATK